MHIVKHLTYTFYEFFDIFFAKLLKLTELLLRNFRPLTTLMITRRLQKERVGSSVQRPAVSVVFLIAQPSRIASSVIPNSKRVLLGPGPGHLGTVVLVRQHVLTMMRQTQLKHTNCCLREVSPKKKLLVF